MQLPGGFYTPVACGANLIRIKHFERAMMPVPFPVRMHQRDREGEALAFAERVLSRDMLIEIRVAMVVRRRVKRPEIDGPAKVASGRGSIPIKTKHRGGTAT